MGRVTVFAIDGCPHCIRAKENLKQRNIAYTEINLTAHPEKRSDMLSLSDSFTVPQIFFNNEHIGGAKETIELLEKLDQQGSAKETIEKEYLLGEETLDPRLEPSTKPAFQVTPPLPRNEEDMINLPNGDKMSVLDMTQKLMENLPVYDLGYMGKTYKNATRGKNVVDALESAFSLDRKEALDFGKYLQERRILDHVTGDHVLSDDKNLYFRLQPYQQLDVLNSFRVWTDRVDPDYMGTVARLSKIMSGIHNRCTVEGGDIDLIAATKDKEYPKFEEEMCELQGIKMDEMSRDTKAAFLINVYNLLIKYAFIKVGVPSSDLKRAAFFTQVKCNIGGEKYSFNDIENGILRGNAKAPYNLKAQFKSSGDPRTRHSLDKVDHRIHFALNCGARSCPPVKKFSVADLDEELRIVAMAFCEQDENCGVYPDKNEIRLSTIFKWYRVDFADSIKNLPKTLVKYLRKEKKEALQKMLDGKKSITVKFNTYDWSSNVTNVREFETSNLKSDVNPLSSIFGL